MITLVWGQSHTNHCDWLLRVNDDFIQQTSHKTPVTVALLVKTPPAKAGDIRFTDSISALGRSPRGGHGNPLWYSCLKNPMDRGDWQATVYRAAKSWTLLKWHSMHTPGSSRASVVAQSLKNSPVMQETWVQTLGRKDPLEKEMTTHSSILAWEIPWTEETGGLQLTGLPKVGHDLVTKPPP